MSESTALTTEQKGVLFNPEVTGIDIDRLSRVYPPVINILQSDKQTSAFGEDENSITKAHYGKLFIRTDENTLDDLKDEIEGTVIKIEQGHEVRDDEGKIVSSGTNMLSPEEKEVYEKDGYKGINMVKALLAIGSASEVDKRMEEYKVKLEAGTATKSDFPFAILVIKGSSWGGWFPTLNAMDELSMKKYGKKVDGVSPAVFKFKLSSKMEQGSSFTYYAFDIMPVLNDGEDAVAMTKYVLEMKELGLFYKVAERIEQKEDGTKELDKIFEGV